MPGFTTFLDGAYTNTMKTLDDIIPPSRRVAPAREQGTAPAPAPAPGSRRHFPMGTFIVALFVIALAGGALFYFASAELTVHPRAVDVTLASAPLTAIKSATDGSLSFQIIKAEKLATQTVASSGTRQANAKAQGTITLYNQQSRAQALVATTRFQTPGGLIFRTPKALTIPAAKGGVPGQISTTVTADKAGSEYNVGPTTFVLPGFIDDPQYTQVTGKSINAMIGGASGNEPVVATETDAGARRTLREALSPELEAELAGKVPAGFILLPGSSEISFAPLPTVSGKETGTADLREQGTIRGFVFSSAALARAIATSNLGSSYQGEQLTIVAPHTLTIKPAGAYPSEDEAKFAFTISGGSTLVHEVDTARIAAAIAGKGKTEIDVVIKQFPGVKASVAILRPFWRTTYPADPATIKVIVGAPVH